MQVVRQGTAIAIGFQLPAIEKGTVVERNGVYYRTAAFAFFLRKPVHQSTMRFAFAKLVGLHMVDIVHVAVYRMG